MLVNFLSVKSRFQNSISMGRFQEKSAPESFSMSICQLERLSELLVKFIHYHIEFILST